MNECKTLWEPWQTQAFTWRLLIYSNSIIPHLLPCLIFLIQPPVVSHKRLKLSACFLGRIPKRHRHKMIIQSALSKQITKFNPQMKERCSVAQRSRWSSLVDCISSDKSSAFKIWSALTARNTPLGNSKQIFPNTGNHTQLPNKEFSTEP